MRRGITSGHKWYLSLPKDWEERKLQYSSKVYSGGTPDRNNLDFWENGHIPWLTSGEINKKVITFSDNFITELGVRGSSTRWVKSGAVLMAMNGQGKTKATVALLEFDSTINQSLCSINLDEEHNNRFVFYYLEGRYSQIRGLVGEDREGLNLSTIKSIILPLPPLETQKQIATFLDKETTRIDTLISKKQKQRELLQEKRQAIITQSVTKGLNPDVKMKDSGVEWIGEIPEHWELKKLKYCVNEFIRGPFGSALKTDFFIENGPFKIYEQKNAIRNDLKIGASYIDEVRYLELKRFTIKEGDFLMSCSGTIGRFVYVDEVKSPGIINQAMLIIRPEQRQLSPDYFSIVMNSEYFQNLILDNSKGSAIKNLVGLDIFKNTQIVIPPKNDQEEIVIELNEKLQKDDGLVNKIKKSINLLKEYRSSLITHAVSGQIDSSKYKVSK